MTERILKALDETGVWRVLAAQQGNAHIVAPEPVLQRVLQFSKTPGFSYGTELPAERLSGRKLFVWDLDRSTLESARHSHPGAQVFGIFRHLWVADACGGTDVAAADPGPAPSIHYAVVCAPRSGSTFLCDLLAAAGLGNPREHVRSVFLELYGCGYTVPDLMRWIIEREVRNGVFGTKLISHFLFENTARSALEGFLRAHNFRVVVLQRDPAEQAVSGYFALQTGLWHLRNRALPDRVHAAVPYDWDAIHVEYRAYRKAGRDIAAFACRCHNLLEIQYGDLDRDPLSVLQLVARFLDIPDAAIRQVDLSRLSQKISATQSRMQEYLSRFRRDLAERGLDADAEAPAGTVVTAPEGAAVAPAAPSARQLQRLIDSGNARAAAALLRGVDLAAKRGAAFAYYAGIALGAVDRTADAIEQLKRAAAGGFAPFWCAYHLGLFEAKSGEPARAAYYYTVSLILRPERTDLYRLLEQVAHGLDRAWLETAQCGTRSESDANAVFALGTAALERGLLAEAASYFTLALAFHPQHEKARARLSESAPETVPFRF